MQQSYIELRIDNSNRNEILLSELLSGNIFAIEEKDGFIIVFANSAEEEKMIEEIAIKHNSTFTKSVVENRNWNEEWEKSFNPINVEGENGNFVHVRASFHVPNNEAKHEIIITPKMSFGTGHHETTCLMIQAMENLDFAGKTVLDFGTGTGILAILAYKLGAKNITGIDYDEWSILNATENGMANNAGSILWILSDKISDEVKTADILLANINLNIIKDHFKSIVKSTKQGGSILLSGLLISDDEDISNFLKDFEIEIVNKTAKNKWMCIHCRKIL